MAEASSQLKTKEPSDLPLPTAAILCIAIGAYVILVIIALIIRQLLKERGICGGTQCCGKEGEPCCECCVACSEGCNCCRNPSIGACLDSCCPQRKRYSCADVIMCECCVGSGQCCDNQEPLCDGCFAKRFQDKKLLACGNCDCTCNCQPPECDNVNCCCFVINTKGGGPQYGGYPPHGSPGGYPGGYPGGGDWGGRAPGTAHPMGDHPGMWTVSGSDHGGHRNYPSGAAPWGPSSPPPTWAGGSYSAASGPPPYSSYRNAPPKPGGGDHFTTSAQPGPSARIP